MKQFITGILILLLLELIALSCANPITPTGGPKDTIPPTLIHSEPANQSLHFDGKTITLTFDERINADKIRQNLIITPTTEVKYKTFIKKETLTILFEDSFEDSTTYTLNFAEGVTDITEKNPAENLIIAFSTGDYIDSLKLFGKVYDLFSGKPMEKITVGIYRVTDTLKFNAIKPTYFINSMKDGSFTIQNIKDNDYRMLAFKDDNGNLLFDPASEAYGFLSDTLHLTATPSDSIRIPLIAIDASELRLISARPSGKYFEAKYTKPITSYTLSTQDSLYIPTQITGESKTLRFYQNANVTDSLFTVITVYDSLANTHTDTVFVKFRESSRKADDYKITLLPKSGSTIFPKTTYSLKFNKPTILLDSSFAFYAIDTFYTIPAQPQNLTFNFNHTEFQFDLQLTPTQWEQTLQTFINENQVDSTQIDSTKLYIRNQLQAISTKQFQLQINAGSFISVESDTSKLITQQYKFASPENFGTIRVNISSSYPSYTVQLMSKDQVAAEVPNCTACVFQNLNPGDYWVRVLIDTNNDGTWSYGNYLKNIPPETILHFPQPTTLRSNWDVQLDYTF